jgi:hypothetical protein
MSVRSPEKTKKIGRKETRHEVSDRRPDPSAELAVERPAMPQRKPPKIENTPSAFVGPSRGERRDEHRASCAGEAAVSARGDRSREIPKRPAPRRRPEHATPRARPRASRKSARPCVTIETTAPSRIQPSTSSSAAGGDRRQADAASASAACGSGCGP